MTTKREALMAAVTAALAGTTGVGTRIWRSRSAALGRGESPALLIEPISDQAQQGSIARLTWTLTVRVQVFVRGDIPDQVADPIIADVHQRILTSATLQTACVGLIATDVAFQVSDADMNAGVAAMDFALVYQTDLNSVT